MMSRKEEVTFLLKRHSESIKSRGYNFIEVARDNVFEDLISTYKKRGVSNKEIKIVFSGEDAVGTGLRVMRLRFFSNKSTIFLKATMKKYHLSTWTAKLRR